MEENTINLTDEQIVLLIKKINTQDGLTALCSAIINKQGQAEQSVEKNEILEDNVKKFIKRAFLIKNYSEELAEEYSSIIHTMVKKELVLQRAFLALE